MISWNTTKLKNWRNFYWKHYGIQNLPECCGLKFLRYCFICQSFRLFQPGSLLTTSTIQVGKLEDCTSSICDFQLNFRLIYSRYLIEYKLRMKISSSTTGLAARSSATKTVAEEYVKKIGSSLQLFAYRDIHFGILGMLELPSRLDEWTLTNEKFDWQRVLFCIVLMTTWRKHLSFCSVVLHQSF